MPLRLLEATIPEEELERIPELIEDVPVLHSWTSKSVDGAGVVHVLLEAKESEALCDRLADHFESEEGFRLILLPVEATLPVVEEPEEEEEGEDEPTGSDRKGAPRISREELYEDLSHAGRLTPVYAVMVALSTVVAAVGLIRGDVAIIIGAMVIAPLLGPNVALSLAATLGDLSLAWRSLKAAGAGALIAGGLSVLLGTLLTIDPAASELAARTRPDVGDVALALAAGAAGTLAFTSGVPAVVVGVMVAVALLPPLVVAGLLAGAGQLEPAAGALVLVLTNVTCINLAAMATFLLQKVRPRTWYEADRAKKAARIAVAIWVGLLAVLLALMLLGYVGGV